MKFYKHHIDKMYTDQTHSQRTVVSLFEQGCTLDTGRHTADRLPPGLPAASCC